MFESGPSKPRPQLGNLPARLGKNLNGYLGEKIDVTGVLRDCATFAQQHGWVTDEIRVNEELSLPVFMRSGAVTSHHDIPAPRVYVSAGIHGDEPAGPLTIRTLLQHNRWPQNFSLWVCPCLNPTGFRLGRRENVGGLDLNRQYLNPQAPEVQAHIAWLEKQPAFDLCLCLHEDWESHGFYIYELNPDHKTSLAEEMVRRVAQVCPIDISETIEGRPAKNGIIRPNLDPRSRPDWPESFYLLTYKTRLSYTLEAPSDFPLTARVMALESAVQAALELLRP